jgi:hypothetical protein
MITASKAKELTREVALNHQTWGLKEILENDIAQAIRYGYFETSIIVPTEDLGKIMLTLQAFGYKYFVSMSTKWATEVTVRWD